MQVDGSPRDGQPETNPARRGVARLVRPEKRLCETRQSFLRDAGPAIAYADVRDGAAIIDAQVDVTACWRVTNRIAQDIFNRPPQQFRIS